MKKYLLVFAGFLVVISSVWLGFKVSAQSALVVEGQNIERSEQRFRAIPSAEDSPAVSTTLVISQFQPGTSASPDDEFIELHNVSQTAIDLNGYRVVYRSGTGSNDVGPLATWNSPTVIQPGSFYLITTTSYTGAAPADITYSTSVCKCSMGASAGGLAIKNSAGAVIDSVGWGSATNAFVEGVVASAPGSGNSEARKQVGCQDTDNNANDFFTQIPFAPRNSSSVSLCDGSGTSSIFATMNANPTSVAPGSNTLLTVTVTPGTNPTSSGISVTGDLSSVGLLPNQPFYDNGTNGDVTAGDNIFSYQATVPTTATSGNYTLVATASDEQGRSSNANVVISVNAGTANEDPLLFGNPTNATADVANFDNYLMVKPQYTLSYNRDNNENNWVAWRVDSAWITGVADRQNDYRPDPALPSNWYHVQTGDYSGASPGGITYERGHMCPSADRTDSIPDNSATFLMTNFVPQYGPNNEGPWADFENYLRSVVQSGNEVYIVAGGAGTAEYLHPGQVNQIRVPLYTWKVVLILPNGTDDLRRVTRSTRCFGVIMPNQPNMGLSQSDLWRKFRVTVDQVESLTGWDFFSNIPKNTQEYIERKHDTQ